MEQRLLPTLISILNTTITSKLQMGSDQKDFSTLLTVKISIFYFLCDNWENSHRFV
jgi:hypothetical protein